MPNTQSRFDTWLATFGDRLIQQLDDIDGRLQRFDRNVAAPTGLEASHSQFVHALEAVDRVTTDGGASASAPRLGDFSTSASDTERDIQMHSALNPAAVDLPGTGVKPHMQLTALIPDIGALASLANLQPTPLSSDEHTTLLIKQNDLAQKQLDELRQIKRKLGAQPPALFAPGNTV